MRPEAQTPFDNYVPETDDVGGDSGAVKSLIASNTGETSNKLGGFASQSVVGQVPVKSAQLRFGEARLARAHFDGANLAGLRLLPPIGDTHGGQRLFECRVLMTFGEKHLNFSPIQTRYHNFMAAIYMTGRIVSPGVHAQPTINERLIHNYGSQGWVNLQDALSQKGLPGFNSEKDATGKFVNNNFFAASYGASDEIFTSGVVVDLIYDERTGRVHVPNVNFI